MMAANFFMKLAAGRSMDSADLNVFRGAKVSRFEEHDFCFAV
ncbi:MAG: hypothetical protein OXQ28_01385 [Acidobacteriota bacterium]|nr:hypothetical protein [Acidobacteriota bacterium]